MTPNGQLAREFAAITEHWSPRVVADANGQYVKIAKVRGEFVWHAHVAEDGSFSCSAAPSSCASETDRRWC